MKKNTQNGITLVALVITIIVLLILAMVSIKIVIDGGLIQKAKDATDTHTIGAEKEAIAIGYAAYQMDLAKKDPEPSLKVKGSSSITKTADEGWDIAFKVNSYHLDKNGNITKGNVPTEDLEYLRKELLGADGKGKVITEIAEYSGSTHEIDKINFNNATIKFLYKTSHITYEVKYNNNIYSVTLEYPDYNEDKEARFTNVEYITTYAEPQGREGQKIEYSYDGTDANKKEWTIIYDYGDTVEIISPEAIGSLELGISDIEAKGKNDFEKALYSYNNSIDRINNYTKSLVTNPNKISVRNVGTDPANPSNRNTEIYKYKEISSWNCQYNGTTIDLKAEGPDINYKKDFARISDLGIKINGSFYWVSSRFARVYDNNEADFGVRMVGDDGVIREVYWSNALLEVHYNANIKLGKFDRKVVPIVKISLK